MHFADYVITEQSDHGTRRAIQNTQKPTVKKFVHSWQITREKVGRAAEELSTQFAIGFGVIAHAWKACLQLTPYNDSTKSPSIPIFIQLMREDFFQSHPLRVSCLITSYDSLELDNALAKQTFTLIRVGNGRSRWMYYFANDAEAVRQLLNGGACVVIEIQITHSTHFGLSRKLQVEQIAPAVASPPNDFRYAYLTQGDFSILCTDGRVLAQRSHLYVSSDYFRMELENNPSLSSQFMSYPTKLVAALVGYIHTLTFAFPEGMCLEDMELFLRLLEQLMLRNEADRTKLRNAAEVWITYRFIMVQKNLREVVRCLCTANEEDFAQMVIPACNFIVNEHFETFADTYKPNTDDHRVWTLLPKLSRSSESDAYLMLRIQEDGGFSPMEYIKRMRAKASFTRLRWH